MIKNFIDKTYIYIFFLPLFFLLHGLNENYGMIPIKVIMQLLMVYISITLFVIVLSLFLLKNTTRATAFSFYILSVFFLFGAFHDFLKSTISNSFIVSYSLLLPVIGLITLLVFFFLRKRNVNNLSSLRYFFYLITVFLILEVATLVFNELTNKYIDNSISGADDTHNFKGGITNGSKPDIYFIVFDGYTSSKCLKDEFNYDNYGIDSTLKANNFFLSGSSKSNYNLTAFSLTSTWNLNYLKSGIEKNVVTSGNLLRAITSFKKNKLVNLLTQEGYSIRNYGCLDIENIPAKASAYFNGLDYRQIDNQTLASRIWKDIGWNFTTRNLFTGAFRVPESYKSNKSYHLYRNTYNFNGLIKELNTHSDTPKFIYAHFILPHEPFYLDSNGRMTSDTDIILQKFNFKEGYLAQLKYSNILLKKIVPIISKNTGAEKVVIIEGDHGYREYDESVPKGKQFMNLNAYYFSDGDYSKLYDGISPVNSFRVIFNKYFSQSFPLLNDSSIFLINKKNGL